MDLPNLFYIRNRTVELYTHWVSFVKKYENPVRIPVYRLKYEHFLLYLRHYNFIYCNYQLIKRTIIIA